MTTVDEREVQIQEVLARTAVPTAASRTTRLREIRERYEASSPGDWTVNVVQVRDPLSLGPATRTVRMIIPDNLARASTAADADFIAQAHADIPWLLEQLAAHGPSTPPLTTGPTV